MRPSTACALCATILVTFRVIVYVDWSSSHTITSVSSCLIPQNNRCHRYVNSFAEKKKLKRDDLLRKYSWEEMIPSEEDLVREPLLRELHLWPPPTATPTKTTPRETTVSTANTRGPSSLSPRSLSEPLGGLAGERIVEDVNGPSPVTHNETVVMDAGVEETKGELSVPQGFAGDGTTLTGEAGGGTAGAVRRESTSARKKETCVAARFEVLQNLNTKLLDALPYLDLCQVSHDCSRCLIRCMDSGVFTLMFLYVIPRAVHFLMV